MRIPGIHQVSVTTLVLAMLLSGHVLAEPQPRMRAALEHLQAAKVQLVKASPDKGGHRAEALRLIERAIEEVRRGIRYDNRN